MGVGGSGKQSLTRLASYVSGLEVFQIQLRKGYSIGDLKVRAGSLSVSIVDTIFTCLITTEAQGFIIIESGGGFVLPP